MDERITAVGAVGSAIGSGGVGSGTVGSARERAGFGRGIRALAEERPERAVEVTVRTESDATEAAGGDDQRTEPAARRRVHGLASRSDLHRPTRSTERPLSTPGRSGRCSNGRLNNKR
ncbi:hypothetical protein ACFQJD_11675 [Haloplanus sp. GCM10025708]|uniref:hypothetical protein n=1 Tax=Haloferacaceae TaxID=1644056 RepID=UPI003608B882